MTDDGITITLELKSGPFTEALLRDERLDVAEVIGTFMGEAARLFIQERIDTLGRGGFVDEVVRKMLERK